MRHAWAARLFERVKELADDPGRTGRIPREAALVYALTGDKRYGDAVRHALVGQAWYYQAQYAKLDLKHAPDFGAWGPWATWALPTTRSRSIVSPPGRGRSRPAVSHRGSAVNFPLRAGQEVMIGFATEEEVSGQMSGVTLPPRRAR
jgi:hypothetical protein